MNASNSNSATNPIDIDFLKKIIGDDKNFEKELFEIFIDNSKYNIAKMESAIVSEDSNAWYMASHAFKGSSASIGAFPLSKVLEISQKSSDTDSANKSKILEDVKKEFGVVEEFIKKIINS